MTMITVTNGTRRPQMSGLGKFGKGHGPRGDLRAERREVRQASGRSRFGKAIGWLTLGLSTAASKKETRTAGQANIIARTAAPLPGTPSQDIALQSAVAGGSVPTPDQVLDNAMATGTDLNSALTAAGITPDPSTASDALVDLRSGAGGGSLTADMIAQYPTAEVNEASCLVSKLAEIQGVTLTQVMWESGMTAALADLPRFREGVVGASGGQSMDGCKPWYKRRATWLVGGAAVAAVIILKPKKNK